MLNNIKHIYVNDETMREYPKLNHCHKTHKEIWFVKYAQYSNKYDHLDYPYSDGSIVAAIDENDKFIVIEEYKDIIERFIRVKQRREKLKKINESI